jgi:UDP-glucuronate 4-epimerase
MKVSKVLVTGCAGFIGYHLCRRLLDLGVEVSGFDDLNPYYDPELKRARLDRILSLPNFRFHKVGLEDGEAIGEILEAGAADCVVHLAAQAGVRYSLEAPEVYIQSNVVGFFNLLEACRKHGIEHLVFASSSSVYGSNPKTPFSENDDTDHPVSLYAATKKSDELLAYSYSRAYGIPCTALRFFTVYGPWSRPDMAACLFTKAILEGRPLSVFNHGHLKRDFTYVDDVVESVVRILDQAPPPEKYRALNVGNGAPVDLMAFISTLERLCKKPAKIVYQPMQAGDVPSTFADTSALEKLTGFRPGTPLDEGLGKFVEWYRTYYRV